MNGQMRLPDTRSLTPQQSRDLLASALAWIGQNPEAWGWIVSAAQLDTLDFGRVRIKSYIETLRFKRIPFATDVIKLPNAFSAPFGRILAAWHPELAHAIPLHSSKTDGMSIPPRPY